MKIGVVTVLQQRDGIELKFKESVERLQEHTQEEVLLFEQPYTKKKQLGQQWNEAIQLAKGCDYVFISGCDDIYSGGLLNYYIQLLHRGFNYIGLLDFYFIDTRYSEGWYFGGHMHDRKGEPLGAGRLISTKILDEVGWDLWATEAKQGLDMQATNKLKKSKLLKPKFIKLTDTGLMAIDLKSKHNIWNATQFRVVKADVKDILTKLNV